MGISDQAEPHNAAGCGFVGRFDHGQHEDAGFGVVFAIHPGDGVEVRELPQEQDGVEDSGFPVEEAAGGGVADERGHGARDRSDGGGMGRALFQRRV